MRAILLCNNSIYARAMATRLVESGLNLETILVERRKKPTGLKGLLIRLIGLARFLRISHFLRPTTEKRVQLRELAFREQAREQFVKETSCRNVWPDDRKVYYFESLQNPGAEEIVRKINPDIGFVFGTSILKPNLIAAANARLINFHSSLLPAYRGFFPEFWQLMDNDRNSIGFTLHFIDEQVDTGEVLYQQPVAYEGNNPYLLRMKNILAMYQVLPEFIEMYKGNRLRQRQQKKATRLNLFRDFTIEARHAFYSARADEEY